MYGMLYEYCISEQLNRCYPTLPLIPVTGWQKVESGGTITPFFDFDLLRLLIFHFPSPVVKS